jgi:hypothetical protein
MGLPRQASPAFAHDLGFVHGINGCSEWVDTGSAQLALTGHRRVGIGVAEGMAEADR